MSDWTDDPTQILVTTDAAAKYVGRFWMVFQPPTPDAKLMRKKGRPVHLYRLSTLIEVKARIEAQHRQRLVEDIDRSPHFAALIARDVAAELNRKAAALEATA